ncbi:MAG TPA: VTT domain-containing protein [Terriglobia bacterium]|nr:VTT domain-containing protein [Terriglobia bacterium]
MNFLHSLASKLEHTMLLYGGWGLLGISALDSAGLSMPGVKDLLLIYLSSRAPGRAWIYALGCTVGTVSGSYFIYIVGQTGARLLERKPTTGEMSRAKQWLVKNDFLTILIASLVPPPLPFKPILLGAGALRINLIRFIGALAMGGILRFGLEAWIGVRYGTGGEDFLKRNLVWISLGFVAIVVVLTILYRWRWRRGGRGGSPPTVPRESSDGSEN